MDEKAKEMNFEEKLQELEKIVNKLETGDILLENAINEFNKAMILAKECNEILEDANKTINKILNKNNEFENFEIEQA